MDRDTIFISHATPHDNEFVRWLGECLTARGYAVWADVFHLKGGTPFWTSIEEVLRKRAVKVIFVVSSHSIDADRSGVRNELSLADGLRKSLKDPGFIVPLRIDETPYDQLPIQIHQLNTLDFSRDWDVRLPDLLDTLECARVPRTGGEPNILPGTAPASAIPTVPFNKLASVSKQPFTGTSSTTEIGGEPSIAALPLVNPGEDLASTKPQQEVRYVAGAGGVQLAYATTGSGYPILKCGNWMSDLQYDRESSVWAHWIAGLSAQNRLIRYDQRGNGLSDRSVEDLSLDAQLADLEAVADAACPSRFALLGISAGSAVAVPYAVRHPERVSHLILYGGRHKGWRLTGSEDKERRTAMASLIRTGWGQDVPAFRQLFSSLFIPDGTPEQMDWYNELQRRTVSPENAARLYEIYGNIDVSGILARVTAPTLVLHASGDALVPFDCGRALAIGIPKARFVLLDSRNHILPSHDPAFARFLEELRRFVRPPAHGPAE